MLKTFNYRMDMGAALSVQYSVEKTQFGDGYAQHSYRGINNIKRGWSGTKTGDLETVIRPIMDFLDEHAGVEPFYWEDPHGRVQLYTCAGYEAPQRKGNHWQITLNFEPYNSL